MSNQSVYTVAQSVLSNARDSFTLLYTSDLRFTIKHVVNNIVKTEKVVSSLDAARAYFRDNVTSDFTDFNDNLKLIK